MRLLHRLPYPATLITLLVNHHSTIIPSELRDYLQEWLPGGDPLPLDSKLMGDNNFEVKLSSFLFCKEEGISLEDEISKLFLSFTLPVTSDEMTGIERISILSTLIGHHWS